MPQQSKYMTNAERQRAYRERQKAAITAELQKKGLPGAATLPTMPSRKRWAALIDQARVLLETAQAEMQDYHDERSDEWQESDKASELLDWIERVEQAQGSVDEALGFD